MDRLKLSTIRKSNNEKKELGDLIGGTIDRIEFYHGKVKNFIIEFEDEVVEIGES